MRTLFITYPKFYSFFSLNNQGCNLCAKQHDWSFLIVVLSELINQNTATTSKCSILTLQLAFMDFGSWLSTQTSTLSYPIISQTIQCHVLKYPGWKNICLQRNCRRPWMDLLLLFTWEDHQPFFPWHRHSCGIYNLKAEN